MKKLLLTQNFKLPAIVGYVPKMALLIIGLLCGISVYGQEQLNNYNATVNNLVNRNIQFSGSCNVTITSGADPLSGSTINMLSDDVWLYFQDILPSSVASNELSHLLIDGVPASEGVNVRVVQYLQGAMVISHSADYQALTVYSGNGFTGSSMQMGNYTFYKATELGSMNDNIQSFVLKKGYMVTMAANEDGTGPSENYVAHAGDIVIDQLPDDLSNSISFVRVIPWRWTTKKGYAGGNKTSVALLNAQWHYDWNNEAQSSLDIEYIPMRHNKYWNGYANIRNKTNTTAALHFNEPNNPSDDGYATVEEALAQWPEMLASGLRVGTPAPTDGGASWLYEFVDACNANGYRIDFVVIHFYRGGQTTSQFYNFLKAIHDRTGLPVWVTEWNNGANWTCCDPTYESQAQTIDDWVDMLESTPFVERYAIYEWVEATRQMFYSGTTDLTPAGVVYRDKASTMAFTEDATGPIISGRTYWISPRHSNKALDVYQSGMNNGDAVIQWDYWGGANQQWVVESTSSGYYRLVNVNSGKALDAAGSSNGSVCQQYSYWGGTNQQWAINDLGNGYYSIIGRGSGKTLDVQQQSVSNGAALGLWDYWGGQNQQFQFNLVGSEVSRVAASESEGVEDDTKVGLFPNPAYTTLRIQSPNTIKEATIYSLNGVLVKSPKMVENSLDVSDLAGGVYIIRFNDGLKIENRMFIKSE